MAIVTTVNETAFTQSAEQVYDFVSNPANWPQAYPGSVHEEGLTQASPLKIGDTWVETGTEESSSDTKGSNHRSERVP